MKWLAACAATMAFCAPISAQDTMSERIEAHVDAYANTDQFQGTIRVTAAELNGFTLSRGLANVDNSQPNTPETQFYIASIAKAFTATMVLQMVDEGLIELDDRIIDHIPELSAEIAADMSVYHLLSHTSGLPRDFTEALSGEGPYDFAEAVGAINSTRLISPPGTRWSYSNTGYRVLAALLERVSGTSYEHLLQTRINAPAELTATSLGPRANAAVGYDSTDTLTLSPVILNAEERPSFLGAAGLFSTSGDLARFITALTDGTLLNAEMLTLMTTAADADTSSRTDGMGVQMHPMGPDARIILASGASGGYLSFAAWFEQEPANQFIALMNDTRIGRRGSFPFFTGIVQRALGSEEPAQAVPTPAHSFLEILLAEGEDAAIVYAATLDWSNPPIANAAASQATGAPNGGVGETMFAWAPATADAGEEWLTLSWAEPIQAHALHIQFTQIPDVLTAVDFGHGPSALATLSQISGQSAGGAPLEVFTLQQASPLQSITLHMNTANVPGWPQIDAVGLEDENGEIHWANGATASTSAFDARGVTMHDLPTRAILDKLALRLEENSRADAAQAVRSVATRMVH